MELEVLIIIALKHYNKKKILLSSSVNMLRKGLNIIMQTTALNIIYQVQQCIYKTK